MGMQTYVIVSNGPIKLNDFKVDNDGFIENNRKDVKIISEGINNGLTPLHVFLASKYKKNNITSGMKNGTPIFIVNISPKDADNIFQFLLKISEKDPLNKSIEKAYKIFKKEIATKNNIAVDFSEFVYSKNDFKNILNDIDFVSNAIETTESYKNGNLGRLHRYLMGHLIIKNIDDLYKIAERISGFNKNEFKQHPDNFTGWWM
jgi:hypothetical protein